MHNGFLSDPLRAAVAAAAAAAARDEECSAAEATRGCSSLNEVLIKNDGALGCTRQANQDSDGGRRSFVSAVAEQEISLCVRNMLEVCVGERGPILIPSVPELARRRRLKGPRSAPPERD
ncbi:uncharacterized protein V6R79_005024 [Siganus canaliculatus]